MHPWKSYACFRSEWKFETVLSSSPCGGDTLLHDVQSGPPGESTEQFLRRSKDQGIPLWELQTDHKYNTESNLSEKQPPGKFWKAFYRARCHNGVGERLRAEPPCHGPGRQTPQLLVWHVRAKHILFIFETLRVPPVLTRVWVIVNRNEFKFYSQVFEVYLYCVTS